MRVRSRRRPGLAVGVALALLAACSIPEDNPASSERDRGASAGPSAPDAPDAGDGSSGVQDATVTGRVVDRTGAPLAGVPVVVVEEAGVGDMFGAVFGAVFTLGIACVADPGACDGGDRSVDATTTAADGTYSVTLPGAYLPGYETDADWVVSVGRAPREGEATGPSSSFELEVSTSVQDAPDLALWDATPLIAPVGSGLRIDLPPLTATAASGDASLRFVDRSGDVIWGVRGTTVDPRLLEDQAAGFVASAGADVAVRHRDGRTIYHQQVVAPTAAHATTLVPTSRGAACSSPAGGVLLGCPATDGDLTTAEELPGPLTVDLGAPAEVGLVVARMEGVAGTEEDLVIEISEDGTTWTGLFRRELSGDDGWSASVRPGNGIPTARYVRVADAGSTLAVQEVSVWPPTPEERAAAEARPPGRADDGDGAPGAPITALAAALLLASAGALLALRRRVGPG